jgi:hypothetical protein
VKTPRISLSDAAANDILEQADAEGVPRILVVMQFETRQLPDPSPPPIKEPPEGPENPDVPVREPDPDEPFQM